MMNYKKYTRQYFMPPERCMDWADKEYVDHAPVWCSVDLRDGNQALVVPMTLQQKLDFFQMLVKIGFKEIEVGFPAASETEYEFLRALIEQNLIPDDVTVQVLTQAREHIIRKTFEALKGVKNAIVHVYNSTSLSQREQVFRKSKEEILQIAVEGAKLLQQLTEEAGADYRFEYSPESFTGTEPEYALEVCNAVLEVWKPTADRKAIINLPVTVQHSMPHVYAQQIEYMCKHLKYRENVLVSLHPHNDRGCGVADTEMGLLAGADRVEGTLFGNGERTGNVDIVTVAMNMYAQGVDPELDFSDMTKICDGYEHFTGMKVNERNPYSGALVFAAFSGSHQDAISKGMAYREEKNCEYWTVPYLPIDPKDVGRTYDSDVIRINSQSGRGGVSYVLKNSFGLILPDKMKEEVGYLMKNVSDHRHAELSPEDMRDVFKETYVDVDKKFDVSECHFKQKDGIGAEVTIVADGKETVVDSHGNGRLNAVNHAIKKYFNLDYALDVYEEHSLSKRSDAQAISYVGIKPAGQEKLYWGAGTDDDIIKSSIDALVNAVNRYMENK